MIVKVIIGDSRKMMEIRDETIDLIVTSPPYWHIKDYGTETQIGYNQSLYHYLKDIFYVWKECFRILKPGTRLCINIGDQFLRSAVYGRYKIAPLHAEFISQCESLGFDYMGSVIWQKKTTMHTTGGAPLMGSFPYPDNGMIEIDYEFVLIFKKSGKRAVSRALKELSRLDKKEWKEYFSGHWIFPGEKQINHEAMFPEELPKRLIKMFSFVGDTVLDPFLGSGTTIKAAIALNRNSIGYEINKAFIKIIKEKIRAGLGRLDRKIEVSVAERDEIITLDKIDYHPTIQDARPQIDPSSFRLTKNKLYKVIGILNDGTLELDTGMIVRLLGVTLDLSRKQDITKYFERFLMGKRIFLKFDIAAQTDSMQNYAYVYLENKIFVNKEMIKLGLARPADYLFSLRNKFEEIYVKNLGND